MPRPGTATPTRTAEAEMSEEAITRRQEERKEKFEAEGRAMSQQVKDIEWLLSKLLTRVEELKDLARKIKEVCDEYSPCESESETED